MEKITPCLWFDGNAEEAATFYAGLLPDSSVDKVVRSPADNPSMKAGAVLAVEFTLCGRAFSGLNGGPQFPFTEAVSFQLLCEDQAELDLYWQALSAHPENERCGWARDRFGLSWQIVPHRMMELLADSDHAKAKRAMEAMMKMKKLDIAVIEKAAAAG